MQDNILTDYVQDTSSDLQNNILTAEVKEKCSHFQNNKLLVDVKITVLMSKIPFFFLICRIPV